jgi:hypothetical protein
MNSNFALTCAICEQDTDCRFGYSNRDVQPLSFACPHCASLLNVTLSLSQGSNNGFKFKSCRVSSNQPKGPFEGKNPFVDLHLDFPVRSGKYIKGNTPYMMAMQDLQSTSGGDAEAIIEKMQFHNGRLNQLNSFYQQSDQIKAILRLYFGNNKQLFRKRVGEFLKLDQGTSVKPQDVNASLYSFISYVFLPFVKFNEVHEVVHGFVSLIRRLHSPELGNFMVQIIDSGFLANLQKDCLNVYPEIYDAEMPMRAALYLDLTEGASSAKTAARISTMEFKSYKDLYKDLVEIFSRQLTLVAGINNLIHRNDHNSFKPIDGGSLSSLEKYSGKTLTEKFKYLDECWYELDTKAIVAGVRNAIAHNNVEYNAVTQEITYYPEGGGIKQATSETMYFLDFMRLILVLFREVHNLHHLIKCLFNYEFLIQRRQ